MSTGFEFQKAELPQDFLLYRNSSQIPFIPQKRKRPLTASMMSEAEKKYLRTWVQMSLNFCIVDYWPKPCFFQCAKIEVDVQIPDENESSVEISVLHKVPGSDKIDVEKLDYAVKEVLKF